jgi:hypothetical protein
MKQLVSCHLEYNSCRTVLHRNHHNQENKYLDVLQSLDCAGFHDRLTGGWLTALAATRVPLLELRLCNKALVPGKSVRHGCSGCTSAPVRPALLHSRVLLAWFVSPVQAGSLCLLFKGLQQLQVRH